MAKEGSELGGSGYYTNGYKDIGSVRLQNNTITIVTTDDIGEMRQYDLVLFNNQIWKVAYPIRKMKSRKKDMVSRSNDYTYSIELVK